MTKKIYKNALLAFLALFFWASCGQKPNKKGQSPEELLTLVGNEEEQEKENHAKIKELLSDEAKDLYDKYVAKLEGLREQKKGLCPSTIKEDFKAKVVAIKEDESKSAEDRVKEIKQLYIDSEDDFDKAHLDHLSCIDKNKESFGQLIIEKKLLGGYCGFPHKKGKGKKGRHHKFGFKHKKHFYEKEDYFDKKDYDDKKDYHNKKDYDSDDIKAKKADFISKLEEKLSSDECKARLTEE